MLLMSTMNDRYASLDHPHHDAGLCSDGGRILCVFNIGDERVVSLTRRGWDSGHASDQRRDPEPNLSDRVFWHSYLLCRLRRDGDCDLERSRITSAASG